MGTISGALGKLAPEIPLCALKPYTGHMGGASDIAEIAVGLDALQKKSIPATLNFRRAEPEFGHRAISADLQRITKDSFLSISSGMGGQYSTLLVQAG